MIIIGGIIVGTSYIPLLFLFFGQYPEFLLIESAEGSGTYSLVPEWLASTFQIFTYGGFGLLVTGVTYRFWRRK